MAPIIPVLCSSAQTIPADYKAYLAAGDDMAAGRYAEAVAALEPIWNFQPPSPLAGHAALQAAQASLHLRQPKAALARLQRYQPQLPEPAGSLLMGKAAQAAGEFDVAAKAFSRVYYEFPLSPESEEAGTLIASLSAAGKSVPAPAPADVFVRAEKLRKASRQVRARLELLAAARQFRGLDRELALVRANYGDYRSLSLLKLSQPEAAAERLYLMHASARRHSRTAEAEAALVQLEKRHPQSRWTMEALISWGNHHYIAHNVAQYEALYRKCVEGFPTHPQASLCHWRLAWTAWMQRSPGATRLLEEHVTRYPDSDKAAAALYFLGRYSTLIQRFPLSYHSTLARSKARPVLPAAAVDASRFSPTPTTRLRFVRARLLDSAGFQEWASFELRYAAHEQPFLAAIELAEMASRRGAHDQALRYIKSVAKNYLRMPIEAAPERFWQLAFPLPYQDAVLLSCRDNGLDPNLVAALIRQESEFNPKAVSRAKALGLTQVLPSTARQISRRVGVSAFRSSMLFEPETNLKLGTHYLRSLLDLNAGRMELTLAAYNAGQSRVRLWTSWQDYREPAEFIESIPFTETREYVQIVLRNADVYRRVWGDWGAARASR